MVSIKMFYVLNYESMGANNPQGMANSDPKSMVGRISLGNRTMHCYILNIETVGLMVLEKIFFTKL